MREREKTSVFIKDLADAYTKGEHNLTPILEYIVK